MSYGILIWGLAKTSLTQKVFRLQKKAIRIIEKAEYQAHTDPIFKRQTILINTWFDIQALI